MDFNPDTLSILQRDPGRSGRGYNSAVFSKPMPFRERPDIHNRIVAPAAAAGVAPEIIMPRYSFSLAFAMFLAAPLAAEPPKDKIPFRVPPGFVAEKIAGSPQVEHPGFA